jgi:hypothetical protein
LTKFLILLIQNKDFEIHRIHPSPQFLSISPVLPLGAEPRIELGPALQSADALSAELRRILLRVRAKKGWVVNTVPEFLKGSFSA